MSIEGPVEIYLRARSDVLKSLFDGIDTVDSAAAYRFALRNLQRHDAVHITKSDDVMARVFSDMVLLKDVTDVPLGPFSGRINSAIPIDYGQGVQEEGEEGLIHGAWPQMDPTHLIQGRNTPEGPFRDHSPFSESIHPLLHGNRFVDVLRGYYLRPDPHTESLAEKEAKMELSHQNRWKHTPAFDNNFLGSLQDDHSAHDYYDTDFLRWLKNQNIGEAELDDEMKHKLREEHFNQRAEQWTGGEHYKDENGLHSRKLGWLGYNLGLEFMPPERRTEIVGHLYKHGSDREEAIPHMAAARLKRNFISRTAGEKNWMVGADMNSGPNVAPIHEKSHKGGDVNLRYFTVAAHGVNTIGKKGEEGDSVYERLWNNHRKMVDDDDAPLPGYKQGYSDWGDNQEGQMHPDLFNMLAGLDENGNLYPKGEHPLYGEKWTGKKVLEPETIEKFKNTAKNMQGYAAHQKDIRNAYLAYRNMFGPNPEFISQEGDLDYYHDHGDLSRTFASHWMEPFHQTGGIAREEETYIEMLHDFLTTVYAPLEEHERVGGGPTHQSFSFLGNGFHDAHPEDETKRGPKRSSIKIETTQPDLVGQQAAVGEKVRTEEQMNRWLQSVNIENPVIGFRDDMAGLLANLHPTVHGHKNIEYGPKGAPAGVGKEVTNPKYSDMIGGKQGLVDKEGKLLLGSRRLVHGKLEPHEILSMGNASHSFVDENHQLKELSTTTNHNQRANISTPHGAAVQAWLDDPKFGRPYHSKSKIPSSPTTWFDGRGKILTTGLGLPSRYGRERKIQEQSGFFDPDLFHIPENLSVEEKENRERKIRGMSNPIIEPTDFAHLSDKHIQSYILRTLLRQIIPPGQSPKWERDHDRGEHEKILSSGDFLQSIKDQRGRPYKNRYGKNAKVMSFHKVPPEEYAVSDPRLHHIMQQREVDVRGMVTGDLSEERGMSRYDREFDKVINSHMNAITNVTKTLREKIEQQQPEFFSRHKNDPQALLSNALELFRNGQLSLFSTPHEVHGQMGHTMVPKETDEVSNKDIIEHPMSHLAQGLNEHQGVISQNMDKGELFETLGFNPLDKHHQEIVQKLQAKMNKKEPVQAMTLSQALMSGLLDGFVKDDISEHTKDVEHIGDFLTSKDVMRNKETRKEPTPLFFRQLAKKLKLIFSPDELQRNNLTLVNAPNRPSVEDGRTQKKVGGRVIEGKTTGTQDTKVKNRLRDAAKMFDSVLLYTPSDIVDHTKEKKQKYSGNDWGEAPIDLSKPGSHSVHDLLNGPRLSWGWGMLPDYTLGLAENGDITIKNLPVRETPLMRVPHKYLFDVFPELNGMLTGDEHISSPQGLRPTSAGHSQRDVGIGVDGGGLFATSIQEIDTLGLLDNVFFKTPRPDPILPMHRIFNVDDLDSLRGFTGEWVVTSWPKGERIMLTRKGDNFTAQTTLNEKIEVPKQVQKDAKKSSEKDFVLDGMLHKKRFYVIDVLKVEDDDIHEMKATERVRLLRATFEPHEHFQPPSPSTLRTTDDDGLEDAIAELEQPILLRDAQSTYMRGELRHPKWVILQKGKKVDLIILDRSGTGPYTYRLGAGPIFDTEGLGPRAVKTKKHTYMDVGTVFRSPQRYEIGHSVKVTVASVKEKKQKGRSLFTVRGGKIHGEGDGPASIETLGILAKSVPVWSPTKVSLEENFLKIELPHLENDVLYKMYPNELGVELQEPQVSLPDQNDSDYVIRLCEAIRDDWEPVAAALLKSKKIAVKMSEKDRKKLAEPPKKVDNPEPHEPFLEPKIVPGTFHKPTEEDLTIKAATLAAKLMDRIAKERMATIGIESLAINHGTGEAAPRGPTTIDGGATMPDWDSSNSEYTEEKEAEEERKYERRKKEKNASVLNR